MVTYEVMISFAPWQDGYCWGDDFSCSPFV